MFANCSVFCDVREVRSSVLGKIVMFGGVRSSVLMFGELYEHLGAVEGLILTQKICNFKGFFLGKMSDHYQNSSMFFYWYKIQKKKDINY